jgi:putative flippase GtrA
MDAINNTVRNVHLIDKFMVFSLVEAIGTLAHYSILCALVEFYAVDPVTAIGWGALAGLFINCALNYSLTFKSRQSHVQTFPKFALIAALGLCLNQGMMGVVDSAILLSLRSGYDYGSRLGLEFLCQ